MESLLQDYGFEFGLFFVVGVFAQIHCLGMCGPLIAAYSRPGRSGGGRIRWSSLRRHFAYHGFRISTYALLGALMGLIGRSLVTVNQLTGTLRFLRGGIGLLVGAIIGLYGINCLLWGRASNRVDDYFGKLGGLVFGFFHKSFRSVDNPNNPPAAIRGSMHAVLPCPVLYPTYLYILSRGSVAFGFTAMFCLGAGTIPLLLGYGLFMEDRSDGLPVLVHRLLGAVFVVLAYITVSMGLRNLGINVPMIPLPYYQPF